MLLESTVFDYTQYVLPRTDIASLLIRFMEDQTIPPCIVERISSEVPETLLDEYKNFVLNPTFVDLRHEVYGKIGESTLALL